ncbi:deaminase domain-containing protein [Aquimarina algiphila]|uniref:deaminase domain-containing protein n=1 Tax=Aquimarina algiphila TaxID=2047982 RepID=UPI0023312735|nr:deaminase domain-containing protein [Aquimarina algiphila]
MNLDVKKRFLKKNALGVPKGVLSGFTIGDSIYNGYYRGNEFTGYKTKKGGKVYKFEDVEVSSSGTLRATVIVENKLSSCKPFYMSGSYRYSELNTTGSGSLLTKPILFEDQPKGLLALTHDECLPNIARVNFDNYIFGHYNLFEKGGFLRLARTSEGGIAYVYSITDGENEITHFQYNKKLGKWYLMQEPPFDCLSCDLNTMFAALYDPSGIGHFTLDAAGMVPLFGEAFDAANGVWYVIEGDGTNAAISFASTIPFVYASTAKHVGKIIKLAENSYIAVRFGTQTKISQAFLEKLKVLDFDESFLKKFDSDLANADFAEAIAKNLELIDAWKVLDDAGVDDAIRISTDELELVSKNIDKIKVFDGGYNAWKINNAGGKLIDDLVNSVDDAYKAALRTDLEASTELAEAIGKNSELLESWKVVSNGKKSLRSLDNIKAVDAFKKANPNIGDDALQAAFDGLKASRRQAFINALESCADNKNLINSLKKSKLATVDEIKDALNKIRDFRTGKPGGGNYGYIEGTVKGNVVDNKVWKSGPANTDIEPQIFDAIPVTGSNGTTWLRNTDSEFKMLNKLADDLGGVKGKVNSEVTGVLKIVSENPYCASCQGIIQQFSDMFPNIEIKLIDGVR